MPIKHPHSPDGKPIGELVIQTLAMPQDTNPNGDIFGGWLVGQMDLGASIAAKVRSRGRTATVAIDKLSFFKPVQVGDTVQVYAHLERVGRTSMVFQMQSWALHLSQAPAILVSEGTFTFVAIDDTGRPREVPLEM
jgi:acyl-CoA thioesterase YciA